MKHRTGMLAAVLFALSTLCAAAGPRVTIIGDSYSTYAGTIPDGYLCYYTGANHGMTSVDMQYWKRVIDKLGGTLEVNNSMASSWLALVNTTQYNNDHGSMIGTERLSNLGDPDLIIIFAGTNDSWNNGVIGDNVYHNNLADYTPAEKAQTASAMCYLLKWISVNKPKAEVIVVSNSYDDGENGPGIKRSICEKQAAAAQHYGYMHVQCHDIDKNSDRHPVQDGFYAISEQILEVYWAAHRNEELVPAAEYEALATSDDSAMRVVRTAEGFAYVFPSTDGIKTISIHADAIVRRALVVGGGGAGGWTVGGGGGGGQVKDLSSASLPNGGVLSPGDSLSVGVGAGGTRGMPNRWYNNETARTVRGGDGENTSVTFPSDDIITALGGGGGGSWLAFDGASGGNGGGGAGGQVKASPSYNAKGIGGAGQNGGNSGGDGYVKSATLTDYVYNAAGGGAGAAGAGLSATESASGNGGAAKTSDILGYVESFGGGGGGGAGNSTCRGLGGVNAGDGSETSGRVCGRSARPGFGGGGGGGGYSAFYDGHVYDTAGGAGGSGLVVLLIAPYEPVAPVVSVRQTQRGDNAPAFLVSLKGLGKDAVTANVSYCLSENGGAYSDWVVVEDAATGDWSGTISLSGLPGELDFTLRVRAVNNLNVETVVDHPFDTNIPVPSFDVAYHDDRLMSSVPATDLNVYEVDGSFAYVFANVTEGKIFLRRDLRLMQVLLVGGGGAGGMTIGGGGGAGEVKLVDSGESIDMMAGSSGTILVGAGGSPGSITSTSDTTYWRNPGGDGGETMMTLGHLSYTALGGGGGGSWVSVPSGKKVASGGGGAGTGLPSGVIGSAGHDGGACKKGSGANDYCPGGGGGAAEDGSDGNVVAQYAGAGGEGVSCSLLGIPVVYGSGGGGGAGNNVLAASGGTNGGAGGSKGEVGKNGVDGTGSGGGGGGFNGSQGFRGGSGGRGTVILVFDDPYVMKMAVDAHAESTSQLALSYSIRQLFPDSKSADVYLASGAVNELGAYEKISSGLLPGVAKTWHLSGLSGTVGYSFKLVDDKGREAFFDGRVDMPLDEGGLLSADVDFELKTIGDEYVYVFKDPGLANIALLKPARLLRVLLAGGGGQGGRVLGGGGGGGALIEASGSSLGAWAEPLPAGSTATLTVGAGGNDRTGADATGRVMSSGATRQWDYLGAAGASSTLLLDGGPEFTAVGGGGGGSCSLDTDPAALSGGCGGGASNQKKAASGGVGSVGKNGGGSTINGENYTGAGGGGGMGTPGGTGVGKSQAGAGGEGVSSNITGEDVVYCSGGGGGGGNSAQPGAGGTNGGAGGVGGSSAASGAAGVDGTGSGGGGGGYINYSNYGYVGGKGGNGTVILRFAKAAAHIQADVRLVDADNTSATLRIDLLDAATSANAVKVYLAVTKFGGSMPELELVSERLTLDEAWQRTLGDLSPQTMYSYRVRLESPDGLVNRVFDGSFATSYVMKMRVDAQAESSSQLAISYAVQQLSPDSDRVDVYFASGAIGALGAYEKINNALPLDVTKVMRLSGLSGTVCYSFKLVDDKGREAFYGGQIDMPSDDGDLLSADARFEQKTIGGEYVYVFKNPGMANIVLLKPARLLRVLLAGGGGQGGRVLGGGGGGGALIEASGSDLGAWGEPLPVGATATLTVGAGGNDRNNVTDLSGLVMSSGTTRQWDYLGAAGTSSTLLLNGGPEFTAVGGGGGGSCSLDTDPTALSGGCGGGASYQLADASGGVGSIGQNGGDSKISGTYNTGAGGGGGMGTPGGTGVGLKQAGAGGEGVSSNITGEDVVYCSGGGGGGGNSAQPGAGGTNGGAGGIGGANATAGVDGVDGTGSGGGGGGYKSNYSNYGYIGGKGGDGTVVLRFARVAGLIQADVRVVETSKNSATLRIDLLDAATSANAVKVCLAVAKLGETMPEPELVSDQLTLDGCLQRTVGNLSSQTEYAYRVRLESLDGSASRMFEGSFATAKDKKGLIVVFGFGKRHNGSSSASTSLKSGADNGNR